MLRLSGRLKAGSVGVHASIGRSIDACTSKGRSMHVSASEWGRLEIHARVGEGRCTGSCRHAEAARLKWPHVPAQ